MGGGACEGGGRAVRAALIAFLGWVVVGCASTPSPPPGHRRVVVVAVDGVTWEVASPLMSEGLMPHLAALYRAGSAGQLRTRGMLDPAVAWTTMATGKPGSAHGILYVAEKTPGRYDMTPVTADRRRTPALWTILGEQGLTVGVVGWPVTFPAEAVSGFMIAPGYEPGVTGDRGYVYPERALGEGDERGEPLKVSPATKRLASRDGLLERTVREDLALLSHGIALHRVYQPRVTLFRFRSVEVASHLYWRARDGVLREDSGPVTGPRAHSGEKSGALSDTYVFLDELVGLLLNRLPEDTTILLVSAHGFRDIAASDYLAIDLNGLMERLGYLHRGADGTPDWSRTRVFNMRDVGRHRRGLFLNLKGREAEGIVEPEDVRSLRSEVSRHLGSLVTSRGRPLFRSVFARAAPPPGSPDIELIEGNGLDGLAALQLPGNEQIQLREILMRYSAALGAHDPAGIFVAAGPGIRMGGRRWSADVEDVLPTLLYLVGAPLARDMLGKPVEAILEVPVPPGYSTVKSYDHLSPGPTPLFRPDASSRQELEDLRALGHLG